MPPFQTKQKKVILFANRLDVVARFETRGRFNTSYKKNLQENHIELNVTKAGNKKLHKHIITRVVWQCARFCGVITCSHQNKHSCSRPQTDEDIRYVGMLIQ